MIDVKIDVGKMLNSLMGGSGQQAPAGTAPPSPEQQMQGQQPGPQPQQQSPQGPQEPDFSQVPLDPVITTGIKSMQQLQGSWDALFDALS